MADKGRQQRNADLAGPSDRAVPEEEGFLARWSRRKGRVRTWDEQKPPAAAATDEISQRSSPVQPPIVERTDADMPPIESLDADSDYAQFLSPKVSERLRRAALRKLFHQPQYNVMDGLDTYIADYRNYPPLGDIVTADMRHQMERQAKAALARLEEKARSLINEGNRSAPVATEAADGVAAKPDSPAKPGLPETGEADAATTRAAAANADAEKGKG